MGGDLNLKKSWHPHLRKNQERVWKEESKALDERKLIEKLRKEREEERAMEELQKLQEAAGGRVATKRVDWMYNGPSADGAGVTEEREGYLLGKRRIDGLLKANDTSMQSLAKGAPVDLGTATAPPTSLRDTQQKVSQDPLLLIQRQKMEMQLKAMKEAQKRAKDDEKREKHKHRHHHRSERSDDRHRSEDKYRRRDRSEDRHKRKEHYRRQHRRSPSAEERSAPSKHFHRSRSPEERPASSRHHRRSRSPDDRPAPSRYRRRSRSPEQRPAPSRNYRRSRSPDEKPVSSRPPVSNGLTTAEKLQKMQEDARQVEEQRKERVRENEAAAAAEAERLSKSDGGKGFTSKLYRDTGDMSLGDVLGRGRQNFKRGSDE